MSQPRRPARAARRSGNKASRRPGGLHPRNLHQGRYDLERLCRRSPSLSRFLITSPRGEATINFADADAVFALNQTLLAEYYQVDHWQLPEGYLCPPIPGRADLIHYAADLLARINDGKTLTGSQVRVLDIGTGANCIYPIIGARSYGWHFVGTDIDPVSIAAAKTIVEANACLKGRIKLIQQQPGSIFGGLAGERFHLSLCNPPFYASETEARTANLRKRENLSRSKGGAVRQSDMPERNFAGQRAELWCPGGERQFLQQMIDESQGLASQVCWFTSLVSNGDNIAALKKRLKMRQAVQVEVIPMAQGQKVSRILAWSFLSAEQQLRWRPLEG
ncbi:23S rRNA (adenine(1618)-N(6))-methyltransferase RlmF [Aestuariirhabdus sp. Z084]|uniref:23S rRNA (adenine(1618)-N(6))-methyltransferase RlmF n=1 Tax=Aestuariirhabdus haliotis TaxID=2918751 RepID=UPI00201B39F7|nr:23S rRNA (adenine(1618)-N(6))-methyltransferase RlmF [Aestuariirhabdus haliotis]MCL6415289.1 23S rRNA (adenine(1618)-N(6))-methyltransferase RlmF [Aestuariirhabdus haliotis]MCL6419549.1 23S rRNA (adenine(1618)-N(6))-methyltransferase RlmF [Aestuariirhabdus haliotis]